MKLANIPGLSIVGLTMRAIETITQEEEPLRENLRLLLARATQELLYAWLTSGAAAPLAKDLQTAMDLLDQARRLAEESKRPLGVICSKIRIGRLLSAKALAERSEALSIMIWHEGAHRDLAERLKEYFSPDPVHPVVVLSQA